MSAPTISFTISGGNIISSVSGYDHISVSFSSDIPYAAFECRATKADESFGRGVGRLICSFSYTPATTARSFDIYDIDLTSGDGEYRISLYAQSEDGTWNDGVNFVSKGADRFLTADGAVFLSA